jgi:hypothetical protein
MIQGGLMQEDADVEGALLKVVLYATTAEGALKPVLCDANGNIITTPVE